MAAGLAEREEGLGCGKPHPPCLVAERAHEHGHVVGAAEFAHGLHDNIAHLPRGIAGQRDHVGQDVAIADGAEGADGVETDAEFFAPEQVFQWGHGGGGAEHAEDTGCDIDYAVGVFVFAIAQHGDERIDGGIAHFVEDLGGAAFVHFTGHVEGEEDRFHGIGGAQRDQRACGGEAHDQDFVLQRGHEVIDGAVVAEITEAFGGRQAYLPVAAAELLAQVAANWQGREEGLQFRAVRRLEAPGGFHQQIHGLVRIALQIGCDFGRRQAPGDKTGDQRFDSVAVVRDLKGAAFGFDADGDDNGQEDQAERSQQDRQVDRDA